MIPATNNPDSTAAAGLPDEIRPTPLCAATGKDKDADGAFADHARVRTPRLFDDPHREIDSLLSSAGILDLGWRAKILVTGKDRVRWLNGMATNAIQTLPQDQGNYNFILNAQGRIQGDCYVYRRSEDLIIDTSRGQVPSLLHHLEHYIIMDAVELQDVSGDVSDGWTALGLAGPNAPQILADLGIVFDSTTPGAVNARLLRSSIAGVEITVVEAYHPLVPRYELWLPPADISTLWQALKGSGAIPAGLEAAETLRVLEGTPLYSIDLNERDLPQETNQSRALNFNKGCYLGQEIVERIRSRGKVHRQFRQFELNNPAPRLPLDLRSGDQVVGRITSAASVRGRVAGNFALGFIREESLAGKSPIEYEGGIAIPLQAPLNLP